jgi:hypothetical protein
MCSYEYVQTKTIAIGTFFSFQRLWLPMCSYAYVGTKIIAIGKKSFFSQGLLSCGFLCALMNMCEQKQ